MIEKFLKKVKPKPFANYQFIYLIMILTFFHIFIFQYDNDLWFTINQGRYILEHSFPTIAINSIHSIDFVYQSWGSGVLFYLIYNYLGLYGMALLLAIVSLLTIYFFYKLCFLISNNKRSSLIISVIALSLYSFYIVTRPQIFTVLNLVIMLYLLESYVRKKDVKYLYWLPLISSLQINMHGIYFIVLLIMLTPYLINSLNFEIKIFNIKSDGYRKKPLFIAFLCMLLTGFINPYGYKTIIYGFSSYQSSSLFNNTIIELMAPDFHTPLGAVILVTIIVVMVLHFSKLKDSPLRYKLLLLGTSYLALDAIKSFYLFLFCSLFPLVLIFKKTKNDYDKIYSKKYKIVNLSLTIILCIGSVVFMLKPKEPVIKPIVDYLDAIVNNKEEIKLFTNYYDGSYAEYRGYNCYLDPRGEIFLASYNHQEDIYEEYDNVLHFKINYKDFIDKYNFDYMIVNIEDELGYLMKYDSYKYDKVMEIKNRALYKLK